MLFSFIISILQTTIIMWPHVIIIIIISPELCFNFSLQKWEILMKCHVQKTVDFLCPEHYSIHGWEYKEILQASWFGSTSPIIIVILWKQLLHESLTASQRNYKLYTSLIELLNINAAIASVSVWNAMIYSHETFIR